MTQTGGLVIFIKLIDNNNYKHNKLLSNLYQRGSTRSDMASFIIVIVWHNLEHEVVNGRKWL